MLKCHLRVLLFVLSQALSVNLRQQTLDAAGGNITRLSSAIERSKATDAARLHNEYQRLVSGMQAQGAIPDDNWLANPVLPDDILREAVSYFHHCSRHILHSEHMHQLAGCSTPRGAPLHPCLIA